MDLSKENFHTYLPVALHAISCACFVSIDLEFSGIPLSPVGQAPRVQSLQERYADNKAAAEKYQILQIGLTVCEEDTKDASYILKPYNISLSPFVERGLDINRDWLFMSWSMEFLMGNNFSIDDLCKHGVRYLSREEQVRSEQIADNKYSDIKSLEKASLKEADKEVLVFLKEVRRLINKWLAKDKKMRDDYLNIPPSRQTRGVGRPRGSSLPQTLNNMEKRLVHQLVTAEYPALKSKSKSFFVQIEPVNPERERIDNDGKARLMKERIWKHVGCRWIIEALVGGDLTDLADETFRPIMDFPEEVSFTLKELANRVRCRLKESRPILVGHNCFMDLIFLYRGFIGPLPDTVEEFQAVIHSLFPIVVDTKYLATYDAGSINPLSSLGETNRKLAHISIPTISIDPMHSKYIYRKCTHEAGYDSMLAAMAFIKLSTQLHKGKVQYSDAVKSEDLQFTINAEVPVVKQVARHMEEEKIFAEHDADDLIELNDSDSPSPPTHRRRAPLAETGCAEIAIKVREGQLMPRLGSEFWQIYGNKLRAFGTAERVVHLGDIPETL